MTISDLHPGGVTKLAGRPVSRIGFGAMQLGELPGRPAADPATAHTILQAATARGVNHFDTAEFYGDGTANTRIREALSPYADELNIVSKVGADHVDGKLTPAQRPEQLRASVEANLATLDAERLAVVNLRRLDQAPGLVAEGDQIVDLDAQLAELISLRDQGKIGAIGLSAVDVDTLRRALPADIVCVQNMYSLLDRTHQPVLELCREHRIAWVPFFPLGSAFPGRPKVTDDPTVLAIAQELEATPAQVGLAWLLADYEHTLLIPGTANLQHLQQNLEAGEVEFTADQLARLMAVSVG